VEGSNGYHLFRNHKLIGKIELGVGNIDIASGDKILVQGIWNLRIFDKNYVGLLYKHDGRKIVVCDHYKRMSHTNDKCWILHLHLKPNKWKDQMATTQLETVN
jgi:hypothetical protein